MEGYMIKKKGSVFLLVIGILAIIFFAAGTFMASTVDESRQTSISLRGVHTVSLAEAGLERAMRILSDEINNVSLDEVSADDLAILMRMPAQKMSGSILGISGSLGEDEQLALPSKVTKEFVLTKEDLQFGIDNSELDDLVYYMTSDDKSDKGIKDYEIKVTASLDKAFRISPGNDYKDFKTPGVDISWNMRPDVKNFLNGEGYSPLEIGFPKNLTWLNFSIPVKFAGIEIFNINLVNIVDNLMPNINVAGKSRSFKDLTSLDFMADTLLNDIIAKGKKKIYPVDVKVDQIPMPKSASELWPAGSGINEGLKEQYLEKYGQIKLSSEAKITYNDGYTSRRVISATKDFKVADCEPIAPMYSFFISNIDNEYIQFNNYGGAFYVKNFDYTGSLGKLVEIFAGTEHLSDKDLEKREFPGLVRVNYLDKTENGDKPIICNVSLMGDWNAPKIRGDDTGMVNNVMKGLDTTIMLAPSTGMEVVGAKTNINADITRRDTETGEEVPLSFKGPKTDDDGYVPLFGDGAPSGIYDTSAKAQTDVKTKGAKDYLSKMTSATNLNLIPNVGKFSTNVIALAVTYALRPLIQAAPLPKGSLNAPDCFQKWEMPSMGTSNSLYTIPNTGTGANKTHLFGPSSMHPTLSREIEGNVLKAFKQWRMCIVGLNTIDRIPIMVGVFLPPLPIPIWSTNDVLNKYDYNLAPLKANKEDGSADTKTYSYDPDKLENMPPNLYTPEQYIKKATYYYESDKAFLDDLPNRMTTVNGKNVFVLNGITFISGSLGNNRETFPPEETFYVVGKGMIVCSGNIYLGGNIKALDRNEDERTVFTLMSRGGALLVLGSNSGDNQLELEASLYTDKGIYCHSNYSLHIIGNWVTNKFSKAAMGGTVEVSYTSSRVRTSVGSLHPERGKFDPSRYHVSFSPTWASWRVE